MIITAVEAPRARAIARLAGIALATWALVWWATFVLTPRGPEINVRWIADLPSAERGAAAGELGLVRGSRLDERTWRYQAVDPTVDGLVRIMGHPAVDDTHGFDRDHPTDLDPGPSVARLTAWCFLGLWLFVGLMIGAGRWLASSSVIRLESPIWARLAIAECAAFTICLGYWLFQIEVPYIDGFRILDYAGRETWAGFVSDVFTGSTEFRPGLFAAVKVIHDVAGGPSLIAFRGVQLLLVASYLGLFVALLKPRRAAEWFGFTAGMLCLVGSHTSEMVVAYSIPLYWAVIINSMLLAILIVLRKSPGRAVDVFAFATSAIALSLVEYGAVITAVWVIAGVLHQGAARRSTALYAVVPLVVYVVIRLATNAEPLPGPFRTETGFLFQEELSVADQRALFEGRAWLLFLYNMLANLLTVLFSEPRAGTYKALDAMVNGVQVRPWQLIHWISSTLATGVVGVWLWKGGRRILEGRWGTAVLLAPVTVFGNVAFGYLYARDRLPALAGAHYAILVALAVTALSESWMRRRPGARRAALAVVLVATLVGWSLRAVGTIVLARDAASDVKDEWVTRFDQTTPMRFPGTPPDDERTNALREELRARALGRHLADPRLDPPWMRAIFDRERF